MAHPELARSRWYRTGDVYFPFASRVDGRWWVLRLNSFPDHPLWTLFIDGNRERFDVEDAPSTWKLSWDSAPVLEPQAAEEALAPVRTFIDYGSEIGMPCYNLFCCGGTVDPHSASEYRRNSH